MITYDAEPCGSRYQDLAGRRFGRLVALERTSKCVSDGCFCWLCRCDCGNLTVTSSNKLLQGRTMSCGCYQKERLQSSRSYIAGTCVEIIRSKKIPASNTSGIRNVSQSRGLWLAKISFARRQFFLGRYKDIADAAAVVEAAEKLRDEVVDEIDQLQDKAVDVLSERIDALLSEVRTVKETALTVQSLKCIENKSGESAMEMDNPAYSI